MFHTLRFRVLVGSLVLLVALFSLSSYIASQFLSSRMMSYRLESAHRLNDVIKKSTRYSMLLNRKEDVYQIITTIGKEPGVEGIRIYNKRGEIMFSTDAREHHTVVDMRAEACFACHDQAKPLESLPTGNRTRIYAAADGHRVLGLIDPIRNEPSCSDAACHAHPPGKTILGVLDVRMSLQQTDASIREAENTMTTYAVVAIVLVSAVSVIFLSVTVLKPVKNLMGGVQKISSGNLAYEIPVHSADELGRLARAFNEMTRSLMHEKEQNRRWAETLQLRIHEKTEELKTIHNQILQIEKMASLGKLSATVAHELNNPLEAILTYAKLTARRLKKLNHTPPAGPILEDIELIAQEAERCGNIVKDLLLFSKKQVGEFALVPVKSIIEKASLLVQHHCAISNVKLEATYGDQAIAMVCDENQIQQALVALFVNGVEAMPDGGTISVDVRETGENDEVSIVVRDTGLGIAQDDLVRIFEPFFTTKKQGRGVGLGLSIVYGIIERHGGRISAESALGKGTTFIMVFPRAVRPTQLTVSQTATARGRP